METNPHRWTKISRQATALRTGCAAVLLLLLSVRGFGQSVPTFPLEFFQFPPGFDTVYGSAPVSYTTNLVSVATDVAPYYGNVLILDATNLSPAYLEYFVTDTNWNGNIRYDTGTVMWFFEPDWASVTQGGSGPGATAYLIAGGDWTSGSPNGLFRIYVDAGGSNLYFGGVGAGVTTTYASTPISWGSNTWHSIGVEYSSRNSKIYLDGSLAATGSGMSIVPVLGTDTNGFYTNTFFVGSDNTGYEQVRGAFWNLDTWTAEYGGWYTNGWLTVSNALADWQATLGGGGFGGMFMGLGAGGNPAVSFSNNLVLVSPWIHYPYTLPDGTFVDFQTLMDTTASNYAVADTNDWQTADLNAAMAWAVANGVPTTLTDTNGVISVLVSTNEGVLYVGGCTLLAARTIETTNVWPDGNLGLNLNGTNSTLFMWDAGKPLLTHVELTPRVSMLDPTVTNLADHSTAVADVLVGAGVNPNDVGMSFAARLQAGSDTNDVHGMTGEAGTNKMRLSNHSYEHTTGWYWNGTDWYWFGYSSISTNVDTKFGNYSIYSSNYDNIAYNAQNYLGVWAAGNDTGNGPPHQPTNHTEFTVNGTMFQTNLVHPTNGDAGGYVTISDDACAKNTLCVGAVDGLTNGYAGTNSVVLATFSGCGPTDDGRLKPDVLACGVNVGVASASGNTDYTTDSGTSISAPCVAGSINLLAEYYAQLHTNAPALLGSTMKALVIATTDQCGTNIGPSFQYGWGLMDTAAAASLIASDATNGTKPFIKEVMLSNSTFIQFPITNTGNNSIKVTIAWTDPPGTGNALTSLQNPAIKLVNDLDLRIISPNGTTNFPYVLNPDLTNRTAAARSAAPSKGDNIRDNVEQVFIPNAANGTYQVKVTHKGTLKNGAPQWVSIITTETAPPQPFLINTLLQTATNQIALGWGAAVGQRYQVQYVSELSASNNWLNIGGQVSARLTNVVELLPYTNSVSQAFYRVIGVP